MLRPGIGMRTPRSAGGLACRADADASAHAESGRPTRTLVRAEIRLARVRLVPPGHSPPWVPYPPRPRSRRGFGCSNPPRGIRPRARPGGAGARSAGAPHHARRAAGALPRKEDDADPAVRVKKVRRPRELGQRSRCWPAIGPEGRRRRSRRRHVRDSSRTSARRRTPAAASGTCKRHWGKPDGPVS